MEEKARGRSSGQQRLPGGNGQREGYCRTADRRSAGGRGLKQEALSCRPCPRNRSLASLMRPFMLATTRSPSSGPWQQEIDRDHPALVDHARSRVAGQSRFDTAGRTEPSPAALKLAPGRARDAINRFLAHNPLCCCTISDCTVRPFGFWAKTGRKADQEPTHSPFAIHFSAEIDGMNM